MANTTYAQRGDVELFGGFLQFPKQKKTGSGAAFEVATGLAMVQDTSVTPSKVRIAQAGEAGPHFMSRGFRFKASTGYFLNDAGTALAALDTDSVVSCVEKGKVLMEFEATTCTPEDRVMCGANGLLKKYDGSGLDKVFGTYKHKPGEGDGKQAPTVITSGLGWVIIGQGR